MSQFQAKWPLGAFVIEKSFFIEKKIMEKNARYNVINDAFILNLTLVGINISDIGCINIINKPNIDNDLFIFLLFKCFQVKYSNNCIEINEQKNKYS